VGDAEAFLAEVRALEPRDPKAAMRQLERRSAAFREAFGVEGVLHGEFRAMVSGCGGGLTRGGRMPRA